MKQIFILVILFTFTFSFSLAQRVEFDRDTRISDLTPALELFDSAFGENRIEGTLGENGDDIRLISNIRDISLFSANDVEVRADSVTFGKNTMRRTDFTFHHDYDLDAYRGLTIENNGNPNGVNNGNHWTLYAANDSQRLLFSSNGTLAATIQSDGTCVPSDNRLKKNIQPLSNILSRIMALQPSTYNLVKLSNRNKSIGFVAQNVKKQFPELVLDFAGEGAQSTMMVNYAGMSVIAIKAIQEQQVIIEEQKDKLADMETKLNGLIALVQKLEGK